MKEVKEGQRPELSMGVVFTVEEETQQDTDEYIKYWETIVDHVRTQPKLIQSPTHVARDVTNTKQTLPTIIHEYISLVDLTLIKSGRGGVGRLWWSGGAPVQPVSAEKHNCPFMFFMLTKLIFF